MWVHPFDHDDRLPLLVEPRAARDTDTLIDWIASRQSELAAELQEHGALLLRGFDVRRAEDFERVALAMEPGLKTEYLGTSPRNSLTRYTFTASELPPWYPIPQHCEMSFTANPPRKLFFCALVPSATGGETPLCDARKVYRDLDPALRARFESRRLRIVRNYAGPSGGSRFDPWKLKRWDEMFSTTDRAVVEQKCALEGFEPTWLGGDRLRLVSTQPATSRHPVTGVPAWFCHLQVFHALAAEAEYRRILELRPGLRTLGVWALARVLTSLKQRTTRTEDLALHVTWDDGSEIARDDLEHVFDVVWRHLVVYRWRQGDVVCIDNRAVSHGRLPFSGPRTIAVAWS